MQKERKKKKSLHKFLFFFSLTATCLMMSHLNLLFFFFKKRKEWTNLKKREITKRIHGTSGPVLFQIDCGQCFHIVILLSKRHRVKALDSKRKGPFF